jgi:hypothetical protein
LGEQQTSQKDLEQDTGVSQTAISLWMNQKDQSEQRSAAVEATMQAWLSAKKDGSGTEAARAIWLEYRERAAATKSSTAPKLPARGPPAENRRGDAPGARIVLEEEEDPSRKKRKRASAVTSVFVGVRCDRKGGLEWKAKIHHGGTREELGCFTTEEEAARAYDKRARQLRPNGQAHGGRSVFSGAANAHAGKREPDRSVGWLRLNFPTPEEEAYAAQQAMPVVLSAEQRSLAEVKVAAVVAKAAAQSFRSSFIGVSWDKSKKRWLAQLYFGKQHVLGRFQDEREAAQAFDTAARQLRPKGQAHGWRATTRWWRVNFPTPEEEAFASQHGMPAQAGSAVATAAVAAAAAQNFKSEFVGVSWDKQQGRWKAGIKHDGTNHHLGYFDDEQEAARAFDTAARRRHAGSHAGNARRLKVNFPTAAEATFAKEKAAAEAKAAEQSAAATAALNAKVAEEKSALRAKAVGDFHSLSNFPLGFQSSVLEWVNLGCLNNIWSHCLLCFSFETGGTELPLEVHRRQGDASLEQWSSVGCPDRPRRGKTEPGGFRRRAGGRQGLRYGSAAAAAGRPGTWFTLRTVGEMVAAELSNG